MDSASACSVCNERTHISRKCPDLYNVLNRGFYSAPSGYRDEEDDAIYYTYTISPPTSNGEFKIS